MGIELEDLVGPCILTLAGSYQMIRFAKKVGTARKKFKVPPPATTGDEGFVRVFRAQQNSVEYYPMFLASMWASALTTHQSVSVVLGSLYLIARFKYVEGYSKAAELRVRPFYLATTALVLMDICTAVGLANLAFKKFTGKTILSLFFQ